MKTKLYIILLMTFSCTLGKKQVFFKEMSSEPKAEITKHGLLIVAESSTVNSALIIYSIKSQIDTNNNAIRITGYQAVGKKLKNEFLIDLEKEVLDNIGKYKLFWIDPDGKTNQIRIDNLTTTKETSQILYK